MDEADEMIGDIIARLIEGDMLSGEEWRPAATLDFLVQGLVELCASDDTQTGALAKDILGDILISMTYLQIRDPDEQIEQEVFDRKWQEILDRIEKPKNKEDTDD